MGKFIAPIADFVSTIMTAETQTMTKAWKYGLVWVLYLAVFAFLTLVAGFLVSDAAAAAGLGALLMALMLAELY